MSEVVVITGASAGIGRATAIAFARRGAKIGIIARGRKGLESTAREIERAGGEAVIAAADVSDAEQLEEASVLIEKSCGDIDIWINNAMTTVFGEFKDITPSEFRRVTEVTYLGVVYGTRCALKRMAPRNRGKIVQVGSALAFRSIPLQAAYCGAKHAIHGFTESLCCELIHQGSKVEITEIYLPAVNTPQFNWCKNNMPRMPRPLPPVFEPELISENIYWVAHHRRRDLILGNNSLLAVWMNRFFPSLLDFYLAKTACEAQQHDGLSDPEKPNNLFAPLDIDPGTRGRFGEGARDRSIQMKLARVPLAVYALSFLGFLSGAGFIRRRMRGRIGSKCRERRGKTQS
ncbi:MAG: SDR family oxidoreductase [Fibrobacter sp.]|jgi:short-subunit dehydrogenase|nr:SDR family oxidoreductase [Fibrobacter sp.]